MDTLIYRERLVSPIDARLKRHINHDSRSWLYAFPTEGLTLQSIRHSRHVPVFDQGAIGSCTGNAGIGCLGTGMFYSQRGSHYSLDQEGAVALYSDATRNDPFEGEYPPTDSGSDGLTIAKMLKVAGEISGYQHTFSLEDALKALTVTPFITGTYWYAAMFSPDPDGKVRVGGPIAGGHEYVADQIDVEQERVWFTNSWGPDWGLRGRFYLTWADYGSLLARQGDVTIFAPVTVTPPEPAPVEPVPDPADVTFATAVRDWAYARHWGPNALAAKATRIWLTAKGL